MKRSTSTAREEEDRKIKHGLVQYLQGKRYRVLRLMEYGVLGVDRMDVKYCIGTHYKRRITFTGYPSIAKDHVGKKFYQIHFSGIKHHKRPSPRSPTHR